MVVEIANIVRAVNVPGTADIEAGSGALPGDVAQTVRAVLDVGAVGINLEDAWELKCVWPRAELVIVDDAGHSPDNPGFTQELIRATDQFAALRGYCTAVHSIMRSACI